MINKLKKIPVAIVFDMDECIGTWSYAGILYGILQYLGVDKGKRARHIYQKHLLSQIIRPDFDKCLKILKKLKDRGEVDDIIIYTANTGVGYPDFIKDCLEKYSDCPGLFTRVLVTHRPGESDKYGQKNLNMLSKLVNNKYKPPFYNVICFDDRLEAWSDVNGSRQRVVKVPAFTGIPEIDFSRLLNDLSKYYGINDIYLKLEKKLGEITYFTPDPYICHKTTLFSLLNNFNKIGETTPNPKDNSVKKQFIPNIRQLIDSLKAIRTRPDTQIKQKSIDKTMSKAKSKSKTQSKTQSKTKTNKRSTTSKTATYPKQTGNYEGKNKNKNKVIVHKKGFFPSKTEILW